VEIAGNGGPFAANRARATLSAFFAWAMGEGVAESNPVVGTHLQAKEVARDRVLTDNELRLVWQSAGLGDFGAIVRLLILTGQRREEVGGMLWQEIDLDGALWSIGAARTKNGQAYDVPLSVAAMTIIQETPDRAAESVSIGVVFAGAHHGSRGNSSTKWDRIARPNNRVSAERCSRLSSRFL
jgi:integrase